MNAHLLGTDVGDVLHSILTDTSSIVFVVNPTRAIIERLLAEVSTTEVGGTTIRVLGEARTLKEVMDDFVIASSTADLVEVDVLELRSVPGYDRTPMIVTADSVTTLVAVDTRIGGLSTTEGTFPEQVFTAVENEWDDAAPFEIRTPARSRITETLESTLGTAVRDDFEAVLDALETANRGGLSVDEVTISLLVAARNEVLLYDISKWGEDVGIASKATFSRTKTKLEDYGLIDTEKVPIEVGRPRLRLKFQNPDLEDADPGDLVEYVRTSMMA
ncbi:MAG: transcriptional regulator TbsP [Halodesulfurarchaeum sp.]